MSQTEQDRIASIGNAQSARKPTGTPIQTGLVARLVAGVRFALSGVTPESWFGPGQPLIPNAQSQQQAKGRAWDFDVGINTRQTPRNEEAINFSQLRALADGWGLLRLIIETRKDQMSRLKFTVTYKDEDKEPDDRCKTIEEFLATPDGEHTWSEWLRMLLEDMLVIDAATIYPRKTLGGSPYALELVDGATIKRVIDATGRTPLPPDPAYQQVLKGIPAVDYSRDELIYKPRNVRTHKVYGYSPVEQIINTINVALRREIYQLQYFTEGSVPDLIMQVPTEWNPDQIKQFDLYWQARLSGNTAERAKTMFVPTGVKPVDTKDKALMDSFDEWIARIACYAFGVSHQPFVKEVNKATAGTAKDMAIEEGLEPVMGWTCDVMNYILARYFDAPDMCFAFDDEKDHDPLQQATINDIYLKNKTLTPDEVRSDLGRDPLTAEQKADLAPPPMIPGAIGPDGKPLPPKPSVPAAIGAAPGGGAPTSGDTGDAATKRQKKSPYAPNL